MKKAIVTTTINPPTKALKKFIKIALRDDWHLFIVGDKKTPHAEYEKLQREFSRVFYLSPVAQERISPELSELIGWNCIQRRNFGLIAAWKFGAEIIATVDDDNIPYDFWGQDLTVGLLTEATLVHTDQPVFNPLFFTRYWHRGFPIQLTPSTWSAPNRRPVVVKPLIQADLWDGDPDVDAVTRIALKPEANYKVPMPFKGTKPGPFNSQNTFLHRSVFPTYFLFPHVGRMDDIWASYVTQHEFPDSVVYCRPSVYQDRNEHDLVRDMEAEMLGYRHSLSVATATEPQFWHEFLPAGSLKAYEAYKTCFK